MDTKQYERELGEENMITKMPFRKGKLPFMGKKTINTQSDTGKLKEPIALIIKDNYDIEIWQNVKPGKITVERDNEKAVEIIVPKSKILSFPWGSETIRGWIVDVREAVALPTQVTHDSLEIKRVIDAMQTNYKNYHAQEIRARWEGYAKLIIYLFIGVAAMIFVAQAFGVDVATALGIEKVAEAATGA